MNGNVVVRFQVLNRSIVTVCTGTGEDDREQRRLTVMIVDGWEMNVRWTLDCQLSLSWIADLKLVLIS
jgi:hypothetical protein